jgi:hypothetical protein
MALSLLDFFYPTKHFSVIRRKGLRFPSRGLEYLHSPSRISNSPRLLRHYHGMAYVPRHIRIASTQQVRPSRPTLCYSSSLMVGCWASNFACRQKDHDPIKSFLKQIISRTNPYPGLPRRELHFHFLLQHSLIYVSTSDMQYCPRRTDIVPRILKSFLFGRHNSPSTEESL